MYGGQELPLTGGGVFATGLTISGYLWAAVALIVIGGAILTLANLLPRVAVESLDDGQGRRLAFTVNGRERRPLRGLLGRS